MSSLILAELHNYVLTLTLNNPEKLNCINFDMLESLDQHIQEAEENSEIRCVVFRGAGDRAFSTGGDLHQFRALKGRENNRWIQTGNQLFKRLEELSKPTLAVITGYAFGGGLELALACDFRFATPNATFGMPELKHGWLPGWGAMMRLKKLLGEARAKELVLLCDNIRADEAFRIGLVHAVADREPLEEKLSAVIEHVLSLRTELFAFAKSVLNGREDQVTPASMSFDVLATAYAKLVD